MIDPKDFFIVFEQTKHSVKCSRNMGSIECNCGVWKALGNIENFVKYRRRI